MEQKNNTNQLVIDPVVLLPTTISPTIDVDGILINRKDLIDQIQGLYNGFFNTYRDKWSKKQQKLILAQKDILINNIQNGNINKIGKNTIDVTNFDNSGIDDTMNGAGQVNIGYISKIGNWMADAVKAKTPHKKFDSETLNNMWMDNFFGGSSKPDLQSWIDLDPADKDGKRQFTGRISALSNLLNNINLDDYTETSSNFGNMDNVKSKLNRLKMSLANGTLDNEDYAAAAALGFNLRTILSNDIAMDDDSTTDNSSSSSTTLSNTSTTSSTPTLSPAEAALYGDSEGDKLRALNLTDLYLNTYNRNKGAYGLGVATSKRGAFSIITNGRYDFNHTLGVTSGMLKGYGFKDTYDYLNWLGSNVFQKGLSQYLSNYRNKVVDVNKYNKVTGRRFHGNAPEYGQLFGVAIKNYANNILNGLLANIPIYNYNGHRAIIVPNSLNESTGNYVLYDIDNSTLYQENLGNTSITNNLGLTALLAYMALRYPSIYAQNTQQTDSQQQNEQVQQQKHGGVIKAQEGAALSYNSGFGPINVPVSGEISEGYLPQKPKPLTAAQRAAQVLKLEALKRAKAANKTTYSQSEGLNLSTSDKIRLGSLAQDIAALGASFAPGYGTAAAGVLGVTSAATDMAADLTDDSMSGWDVAKNFGMNLGLAAAGLIPGGKSASIISKGVKWGARLLPILMASQAAPEMIASFKKWKDGKDLTETDFKNIYYGIKLAMGGTRSATGMAKNRFYKGERETLSNLTVRMKEINVKSNGENVKVKVTPELLQNINKAKTQSQANARLQQALTDNGVLKSSEYSIQEGLFPEKVSINPFSNNKSTLQGTDVVENVGNGMHSDRWYANQDRHTNHANDLIGKYFRTDYDIFVDGKSPVHLFNTPKIDFTSKPTYNRATSQNPTPVNNGGTTPPIPSTPPTPPTPSTPSTPSKTNITELNKSELNSYNEIRGGMQHNAANSTVTTNPYATGTILPDKNSVVGKLQDLFVPGLGVNVSKLNEFVTNNRNLFNKLPKKDLQLLNGIMTPSLFDTDLTPNANTILNMDVPTRKEVLNILNKMVTPKSSKGRWSKKALEANMQVLSQIRLKLGGIIKAKEGTKTATEKKKYTPQVFTKDRTNYGGITNTNNNTTWYNNVFSPYELHIIDNLKLYNKDDAYGNWLNARQVDHYGLYSKAGNNFLQLAYNDNAEAVKKYQQLYDTDELSKTDDKVLHGYNSRGIEKAVAQGRYANVGYTKRNGQDSLATDWTPDGSYSGQTDDRRILGRKGDFTDDLLKSWNDKLKNVGWEQYLDENDGYYKLRRLTSDSPNENISENKLDNKSKEIAGANATVLHKSDILGKVASVINSNKPAILGALRAGWDERFNNKLLNLLLENTHPVLEDTYDFNRKIYGDYATRNEYERAGANARMLANRIAANTADSYLGAATLMLGAAEDNENRIKGRLADNDMIRKTYELSLLENKENIARHTATANANKLHLNDNERERLLAILATKKMNHDNWERWYLGNIEMPAAEDYKQKKAMLQYLDYNSLLNEHNNSLTKTLQNIRATYLPRYDSATTTEEKTKIMLEMQNDIQNASMQSLRDIYNELAKLRGLHYDYTPEWSPEGTYTVTTPTYKAKGGILETMIKESNKSKDRVAKLWKDSLDAFWRQFGKLKLADYSKK